LYLPSDRKRCDGSFRLSVHTGVPAWIDRDDRLLERRPTGRSIQTNEQLLDVDCSPVLLILGDRYR